MGGREVNKTLYRIRAGIAPHKCPYDHPGERVEMPPRAYLFGQPLITRAVDGFGRVRVFTPEGEYLDIVSVKALEPWVVGETWNGEKWVAPAPVADPVAQEFTLRDRFALRAFPIICRLAERHGKQLTPWEKVAEASYIAADAMVAARDARHG